MHVPFFCVFLGATACFATSPAIQTSAGLAGYPRRGLNLHLPLSLSSMAFADVTSIEADGGALTIRPRRLCTCGRSATPAGGIEPTFLIVNSNSERFDHSTTQATELWSHCTHASPHAAGNGAP